MATPGSRMPEEDVGLDPALLKVLASDTRLDILKLLRQRRMTLTELANALGLKKATILEHLERLTGAGLVRRRDDEERLWIYYELTRRGGHVVNPGAARFYLVVGTSIVAGLVAIALMLALQQAALPPTSTSGPPSAQAEGPRLTLLESQVLGGGPVTLHARQEGVAFPRSEAASDASTPNGTVAGDGRYASYEGAIVRAYLVPSDRAEALLRAGERAPGAPLDVVAQGALVELRSAGSVPPGRYHLYLVDAQGRDNRDRMPLVTVEELRAEAPPRWWRGLDPDLEVRVRRGDAAPNGTLFLASGLASDAALAAEVAQGAARFPAAALDRLAPGDYALRFAPAEGGPARDLTAIQVREPLVAAQPRDLAEGARTLQVVVLAEGRTGLPEARLDGAALALQGAGPAFQATLPALAPGAHDLQVGRLAHRTLTAHRDLRPTLAALGDGALELTLRGAGGAPVAGIGVVLDEQPLGFTNASGALRLASPASGLHRLAFLATEGSQERVVAVEGWNVTEPPAGLVLVAEPAPAPAGQARVRALLANPAPAAASVNVVGALNGTVVASEPVSVPPRGNATVELTLDLSAGSQVLALRAEAPPRAPLVFVNRSAPGLPPTPPSSPSPSPPGAPAPGPSPPTALESRLVASAAVRVDVQPLPAAPALPPAASFEELRVGSPAGLRSEAAKTPGLEPLALLAAALLVALATRRR